MQETTEDAAVEIPPEAPAQLRSDDVKRTAGQAQQLAATYENFAVASAADYSAGAEHLRTIKAMRDDLETQRFAITRPMDTAKRAVMDFFRPFETRLADAERIVKRRLTDWKSEQDRIAREKQRQAEERARNERERLEREARQAEERAAEKARQKAGRARQAAEARAAEERAERARRQAAADAEEQKRIRAEQAEAEARHQRELERIAEEEAESERKAREENARAETLRERASMAVAAPVAPSVPKAEGISSRKKWCFKVVDPAKVPEKYKMIDEKKIGKVVRALGDEADLPGVEIWSEDVMAARRAT